MSLITVVLVVAVLVLGVLVLRLHGTNRGGALVKLGLAAFLVFAVYAILWPDDVTWLAGILGVGRGTDLILYLLVVGCGFFAVSTFLRFKELELRFARLARTIALSEARRRDESDDAADQPPS